MEFVEQLGLVALGSRMRALSNRLYALADEAYGQHDLGFRASRGVPLQEVLEKGDVFDKLGCFKDFADALLATDEIRRSFNIYDNTITALYEACKPEVPGSGRGRVVLAFQYLRGMLDVITQQSDIDSAVQRLGELLDQSVVVENAGNSESGGSLPSTGSFSGGEPSI